MESVSPELVVVNKGNRKDKAAGASQLLRCSGLMKANRYFFGVYFIHLRFVASGM